MKDNIIFQDNRSAILLSKNGKSSSMKRTKHIDIRYFFITDKLNKGEVSMEWCPTGDMIADFFTKPVQGSQFQRLHDAIMGMPRALIKDEVLIKDKKDMKVKRGLAQR